MRSRYSTTYPTTPVEGDVVYDVNMQTPLTYVNGEWGGSHDEYVTPDYFATRSEIPTEINNSPKITNSRFVSGYDINAYMYVDNQVLVLNNEFGSSGKYVTWALGNFMPDKTIEWTHTGHRTKSLEASQQQSKGFSLKSISMSPSGTLVIGLPDEYVDGGSYETGAVSVFDYDNNNEHATHEQLIPLPSGVGYKSRFGDDTIISDDGLVLMVTYFNPSPDELNGKYNIYKRAAKNTDFTLYASITNEDIPNAPTGDIRWGYNTRAAMKGDGSTLFLTCNTYYSEPIEVGKVYEVAAHDNGDGTYTFTPMQALSTDEINDDPVMLDLGYRVELLKLYGGYQIDVERNILYSVYEGAITDGYIPEIDTMVVFKMFDIDTLEPLGVYIPPPVSHLTDYENFLSLNFVNSSRDYSRSYDSLDVMRYQTYGKEKMYITRRNGELIIIPYSSDHYTMNLWRGKYVTNSEDGTISIFQLP